MAGQNLQSYAYLATILFLMVAFVYCLLIILDRICSTTIESSVSSPIQQEAGIGILKESEREAVLETIFANAAAARNISYQQGVGRLLFGFGYARGILSRSSEQLDHACCICLNSLEYGENVMTGTLCSHIFHCDCIMEWLIRGKDDCPVCRQPMMTADEFRTAALQVLGENHEAIILLPSP